MNKYFKFSILTFIILTLFKIANAGIYEETIKDRTKSRHKTSLKEKRDENKKMKYENSSKTSLRDKRSENRTKKYEEYSNNKMSKESKNTIDDNKNNLDKNNQKTKNKQFQNTDVKEETPESNKHTGETLEETSIIPKEQETKSDEVKTEKEKTDELRKMLSKVTISQSDPENQDTTTNETTNFNNNSFENNQSSDNKIESLPYIKRKTKFSGDGEKKKFYSNGTLYSTENFIAGKKEGLASYYTKNGYLKMQVQYKNDLIDGKINYFNHNRIIIQTETYSNGKKIATDIESSDEKETQIKNEINKDEGLPSNED